MKRLGIGALGLATLMVLPIAAMAQQRGAGPPDRARGSRGWGMRDQYVRLFDPATVEEIQGEVVEINYFSPKESIGRGVHMVLKTGAETIPVHLGPAWFFENQDFEINSGDEVSVVGSRITFEGKPTMIAAEVHRGDEMLLLRDDWGVPQWSGSRHAQFQFRKARRPGAGWGWGLGSPYARLFNPSTIETVTGEVVDMGYFRPRRAPGRGMHLKLQTENEIIPVHLGPEWFLENQELQINLRDKIVVTGSRLSFEGETAMIASEIRRGEEVLELRDSNGRPRWAAWRQSGSMQDR